MNPPGSSLAAPEAPDFGPLPALLQRRFMLISGKGGVGKTTTAAAIARLCAAAGRRTLLCELNVLESQMPPLFGAAAPPEGAPSEEGTLRPLAEHLWTVNIRPAQAMEEYGVMKLRLRMAYRVVFNNALVQRLVRFMPGLNELLMLGKAFNHERERDAEGRPVWDTIIIDAPATGHGVPFFRLPRLIRDAVPTGNLHREAVEMWGLMTDPQRTAVHLVTLPEELPIRETHELYRQLTEDLSLPLGALFVNQMPTQPFSASGAAAFSQLAAPPAHTPLGALWQSARIRLARTQLAQHARAQLDDLRMPVADLPQLFADPFALAELDQLALAMAQALRAQEPPAALAQEAPA